MSEIRTLPKVEVIREFAEAAEFPLRPGEQGDYRAETYNCWVYDPVADVGLNVWFAAADTTFAAFLVTVILYDKGKLWYAQSQGSGNPTGLVAAGNGFLAITSPYKRLDIEFLGVVSPSGARGAGTSPIDPSDLKLCRMELAVDIMTPPIEQGSQGDRGEKPASGTTPRAALRYEQLCRVTGPIRLGDRTIQLNAYGMRSHRRNSASIYDSGAVGHSWATALFPSGRGFHLLSYQIQPSAAVGALHGHYFDGVRYHDAEVTRFPYFTGALEPERYELELKVAGRPVQIQVKTQTPLYGEMPPPHSIRLTRSPGRFTLDGEVGGGVVERSLAAGFEVGGEYVV